MWKMDATKPLFNDDSLNQKFERQKRKQKEEQEKKIMDPNVDYKTPAINDLLLQKDQLCKQLKAENDRLKHFLPDSYAEIRL